MYINEDIYRHMKMYNMQGKYSKLLMLADSIQMMLCMLILL